VENPLPYGIVITEDDGKIVRFMEKPSWGKCSLIRLIPAYISLSPHGAADTAEDKLRLLAKSYPLMLSKKMDFTG